MIDSSRVTDLLKDSLFRGEEIPEGQQVPDDAVLVDGVINRFALHPERLQSHDHEVAAMIDDLPIEFFGVDDGGGGGWSFLNLCMTRGGQQWTGLHMVQEQLLALAIGLKRAKLQPRHQWPMMPGGMPYITFYKQAIVEDDGDAALRELTQIETQPVGADEAALLRKVTDNS